MELGSVLTTSILLSFYNVSREYIFLLWCVFPNCMTHCRITKSVLDLRICCLQAKEFSDFLKLGNKDSDVELNAERYLGEGIRIFKFLTLSYLRFLHIVITCLLTLTFVIIL